VVNTNYMQAPQIDFYLLSQDHEIFNYSCRLTEKAFSTGFTVFILTKNVDDAKKLDDLLWSFRADSFIPHQMILSANGNNAVYTDQAMPVIIGHTLPAICQCTLLINLADKAVTNQNTFKRICHVVSDNAENIHTAKQAYATYKRENMSPKIINV